MIHASPVDKTFIEGHEGLSMKKTFPLQEPRRKPARVLDAIKHEVRKYLKRERRKELPEGADFWDFDCQVGPDGPARVVHVGELIGAIDAASTVGGEKVYNEILRKPGKREHKASTDDQ